MARAFAHILHYRCEVVSTHPIFSATIECDSEEGHLVTIGFVRVGPLPAQATALLYPDFPELGNLYQGLIVASDRRFAWYLDLLRNESVGAVIDTNADLNEIVSGWAENGWGHAV
jgi:hypothetical protein